MAQHLEDVDRINIAIDGPAGAGKSTVARRVANELGYIYIDTGAMYRAVTLSAQRLAVKADEEEALTKFVHTLQIRLEPGLHGQLIFVNDEDVTDLIRTREVTHEVSYYSANATVREVLGSLQRVLAAQKGVVMDGRDIGTHILPDAELKVFLTASASVRALRRYKELPNDDPITLSQLEDEINRRDQLDEQRVHSPLIKAFDAWTLDSSNLSIEEVVDVIVQKSRTKLAEAK